MAQCPAHDDRNPSLSLRQSRGRALVYCHGGCPVEDVLEALGLGMSDLFDVAKGVDYVYSDGRVVHRSPQKAFYQSGKTKADHSVLYVPKTLDLRAALAAQRSIFIPEGEQDVDLLDTMGIAAVTSPMGAMNWAKCDYSVLTGARNVIIIQDRDDAGRQRANGLYHHLRSLGAEVIIVQAAVGNDVTDHIMAGRSIEELEQAPSPLIGGEFPDPIVIGLPEPEELKPSRLVLRTTQEPMKPMRWAWKGVVPMGTLTVCVGRGDVGKSTFVLWMAAQFQRGMFPGRLHGRGAGILIISQEDDWNSITLPRLWANGAELRENDYPIHQMSVRMEEGNGMRVPKLPLDIQLIEEAIEQTGAQILVIDPLISTLAEGLSGDRAVDVRAALDPLADLAMRRDISIIGVAHVNKNGGATAVDRMSGSHAWRDAARAVLMFAKDEDSGQTIITHGKGNYQQGRSSYAYKMHSEQVPVDEPDDEGNMFTTVGRVEFLGTSERTVDDVFTDEVALARTGDLSRDVAAFVRQSDRVLSSSEIEEAMAEDYGVAAAAVRQSLARLVKRGVIHRYGRGKYGPPPGMHHSPGPSPSDPPGELCADCGMPLPQAAIDAGERFHATCGL